MYGGYFLAVLISFREWLHSYYFGGSIWTSNPVVVLISFREWLHSYVEFRELFSNNSAICSHLFQRVASFLLPTRGKGRRCGNKAAGGSHLFQRVASFLQRPAGWTEALRKGIGSHLFQRVASFLLINAPPTWGALFFSRSHLFQRVASFLPKKNSTPKHGCCRGVLISFREWLHSYVVPQGE